MELLIVQQGAGLHFELTHRFLDLNLTNADRAAWAGMFSMIETMGRLKLYLPSEHLGRDACLRYRQQVSGYFRNGEWIDLYKIRNEQYARLKKQHLDILPYIPFHTVPEIAGIFKGIYSESTISTYRTQVYGELDKHSQAEVLYFMQSMNLQPVLNTLTKQNFPLIKSKSPFGD